MEQYDKEILPLRSPSSWSYDAVTRSLNINKEHSHHNNNNNNNNKSFYKNGNNGSSNSIISLLNECEFSPVASPQSNDDSEDSYDSMPSDDSYDISSKNKQKNVTKKKRKNNNNNDAVNSTEMMAGYTLLCISGMLDAGTIAYVNWLNGVGFNMEEILMYQGIVQIILCFFFGIITLKVMARHNSHRSNKGMRRNVSFRSLVLPFSMEYNVNFVNLCKTAHNKQPLNESVQIQSYNNKYGALSDLNSNYSTNNLHNMNNMNNEMSHKNKIQLIIAIISFGIIQFASHLTYFIGYLEFNTNPNHFEIAPLFNSLAIVFAFIWSYIVYQTLLSCEVLLYLFFMYIGVAICAYSFIRTVNINYSDFNTLVFGMSNIYLISSALFESFGYILIKYASNIPTFILVFSQSVFCCVLGLILFETSNDSFVALNSFSDVIEMSSVGLIGFWNCWAFVRGTQLISIGTASFLKMTFFIIFSIVIQVFFIDAQIPHFYCIFGLCLILLSIILMLIEKFSKFRKQ